MHADNAVINNIDSMIVPSKNYIVSVDSILTLFYLISVPILTYLMALPQLSTLSLPRVSTLYESLCTQTHSNRDKEGLLMNNHFLGPYVPYKLLHAT